MGPITITGKYSIEDLQNHISKTIFISPECRMRFYNLATGEPIMFISSIMVNESQLCVITSCKKVDTHILDGVMDVYDYCLLIEDQLNYLISECDDGLKVEVYPLTELLDEEEDELKVTLNMNDLLHSYSLKYEELKERRTSISSFAELQDAFDTFMDDTDKITMIVRFSIRNPYIDAYLAFQLIIDKMVSFSRVNLKFTICRPDLDKCPIMREYYCSANIKERNETFLSGVEILKDYCHKVSDEKYRVDLYL